MHPALIVLAILAASLLVWWFGIGRRAGASRWGSGPTSPADARVATQIAELAARAESDEPSAEPAPRGTALDAEKAALRATQGGRVRLRGAVVGGELRADGLLAILVAPRSPGEHAKATRVLLHFFPLPVAVPILKRALLAIGPGFLPMARHGFEACRVAEQLDGVLAAVEPADEGWMLGALPFADRPSQAALGRALGRVGGRRSLEAMRLMVGEGQARPWVAEVRAALRARLAAASGGLSVSAPRGAEGGLSPTDDPGAPT